MNERLWTALKRLSDAAPVELAPLIDEVSAAADAMRLEERRAPRLVVGTIRINRHDEFENRSFPCEIDADQIESIHQIDRRGGLNAWIRTRSGEQFACANDYADVRRRWIEARS